MHDGGGLESVALTLATKLLRGDAAKLVVDLGKRLLRCLPIPAAPPLEKLCERWFSHDLASCPSPIPHPEVSAEGGAFRGSMVSQSYLQALKKERCS